MANTINVTSDTVIKLIIRRGIDTDRQSIVLASGELGYTIDTKRVFIGDGVTLGGNLVGTKNFGVVQGIQQFTSPLVQPGDLVFQNLQNTGAPDNQLYTFNNNQWQSISPTYGAPFDYTSGALLFNANYLNLDTVNNTFNVVGTTNTNALITNAATINNTPVNGTDGVNKAYVDGQISAAEGIDQAYTRTYVGNNYVPLSGQTIMFGTLSSTVNISVSSTPILGADVTNKNYVDTSVNNALIASRAFTQLFLPLSGGTLSAPGNLTISTGNNGTTPAVNIVQSGNAPALIVQDVNRTIPQSFYVDNYGSVGIGIIPPNGGTTALTIYGTASASNVLATNVWSGSAGNGFNAPATNTIAFRTANTEAFRVDPNGNLGIGTTTPQYKLDITGRANITGILTVNGSISATGDVVAYASSDARLKLNVAPITSALDKIDSINGVTYDWDTNLQSAHCGHDVGVLAQEIETILPEAVITREDGYKAVRYEKIIPLLIQAIKELKASQQS